MAILGECFHEIVVTEVLKERTFQRLVRIIFSLVHIEF